MKEALKKAEILTEALHWIREYRGKKVVIKYGGNAITTNTALKATVISDIVAMRLVGINPVVIHGGGPEISRSMKEAGIKPEFVEGLRVTDAETISIVKDVLVNTVNADIVALMNKLNETAQNPQIGYGVSGDEGLILAEAKRSPVGLGYVGQVRRVDVGMLQEIIEKGLIPVVAPLGLGPDGETYNINADQVAGEVAAALSSADPGNVNIVFLTDVDGLYGDFEDKSSLISELDWTKCQKMIDNNQISEGMIPKVKGSITALRGGVPYAHILNGARKHALLVEMFTDTGIGTMIRH
jgi:acetylglutamate kinase